MWWVAVVGLLATPECWCQAVGLGCPMRVTVDPLLWAEYRDREEQGGEGRARARFHLTSLVGRLVNAANRVLGRHTFANTKYGLVLKEVVVLEEGDCESLGFALCSPTLALADLLDGLSYRDQGDVCLSYLLTHRLAPATSHPLTKG